MDGDGEDEIPGANTGDYVLLDDSKLATTPNRGSVHVLGTSWLLWPVFVVAVIAGSFAAPITLTMQRVGPVSTAGWRHQVTAMVLLPCCFYQWSRSSELDRQKFFVPRNLGLLFLGGVALAGTFGTSIWGLYHTSMTHALFLQCMSPAFVALYTNLFGGVKLKTGEIAGVTLGLFGVAILGAGTKVEKDNISTYAGDFAALTSAIIMAAYLLVCKNLRSWMPLFVYQFPVSLVAATLLGMAGLLLEGWNESDSGNISGPFGWLRKEYLLGTILLGVGPGILGHAGYSFVVKYSSPLVMPTGLSLQPIIGSAVGWSLGQSPTPGIWTCIGGAVTLGGTCYASCASAIQKVKLETKEDQYEQPAVDEEWQQGTKPLLQPSGPS